MPKPVHRDVARRFLVGIAACVLAGVIGLVGAIVQTGGALPGKSYTYVTAAFGNVGTLNSGKDVKENGIRTGTVSQIVYSGGQAIVTLRLDGPRTVYRDARASVGDSSALGKKYIEFDPGTPSAGPLGNAPIPSSQTKDSSSLETVLDALDPQTRSALASSLQQLGTGLAGHGADLNGLVRAAPGMLDDVSQVAAAASSPDANLPGLLNSADNLVGRFSGREQQLTALVGQLDTTLRAVDVDNGAPLRDSLQKLPQTLVDLRGGLASLNAPLSDVRAALTTIEPGAQSLGQATPDLRGLLREGVTPLRKVPGVSKQALPAVDDLTHTLSDARPLVPQLAQTLHSADLLLFGLAPYAPDAGRFFSEHDLLSGQLSPDQHYFAAMLAAPSLYSVAGLPDPLVKQEPYPAPGGGAWHDTPGGTR
ncbi:MCE family protein [Amycolatopsis sp. K13G38]|uniref:MCE family protein n=1 Tax=Amycolatopsis acididurans TaxID=2724524 RepID=A0ABX1J736_9PSEU|nr:MlaD family protein [Amycolatopsis acididurans]NKQ54230.1 MCE family protein [Amycolatopsis acididurans]